MSNKPLVSIIIYNYNYGRFLRECFDSVLNQHYSNIEILFSDNASTDDSWEIACSYSHRFPDKISLARNHVNFGAKANLNNCMPNIRGKYFIMLGSDDVLHTSYIETAVKHLECNLDAGYLIAHRSIINHEGKMLEDAPFYNDSFLIPAPKQAVVNMMASINPTVSQIVYRNSFVNQILSSGAGIRFQGIRIIDFELACKHAVIYIHHPLVFHRVHHQNDANYTTENLMDVLSAYVMNFDFVEHANGMGINDISEKLPASIQKNAHNCLRYSVHFLRLKNFILAKRYHYLAYALFPDIENEELFKEINQLWSDQTNNACLEKIILENPLLLRKHSYAPPEGSVNINA